MFTFRGTAAAGLRSAVVRAMLRADPAHVVRFRCTLRVGEKRFCIADGDMRDLALWNEAERRGAPPTDARDLHLLLLPIVPGYLRDAEELDFEVTTAEPAVYVTALSADQLTLFSPVANDGMFLRPRCKGHSLSQLKDESTNDVRPTSQPCSWHWGGSKRPCLRRARARVRFATFVSCVRARQDAGQGGASPSWRSSAYRC